MRASDVLRANDATQQDNSTVFVDQSHLTAPLASLTTLSGDIDTFVNTTLAPLLVDTTTNRAQMIAQIDIWLADAVVLLERAARATLPSSGWGFIYAWLSQAFTDLLAQIGGLVVRWTQKLSDFNNALNAYDGLPVATSDADCGLGFEKGQVCVTPKCGTTTSTQVVEDSVKIVAQVLFRR